MKTSGCTGMTEGLTEQTLNETIDSLDAVITYGCQLAHRLCFQSFKIVEELIASSMYI